MRALTRLRQIFFLFSSDEKNCDTRNRILPRLGYFSYAAHVLFSTHGLAELPVALNGRIKIRSPGLACNIDLISCTRNDADLDEDGDEDEGHDH